MVEIKLDSTYTVSSDSLQFILLKGNKPYKFAPEIKDLLYTYIDIKQRGSEARDIHNLIKTTERAKSTLTQALAGLQNASQTQLNKKSEGLK